LDVIGLRISKSNVGDLSAIPFDMITTASVFSELALDIDIQYFLAFDFHDTTITAVNVRRAFPSGVLSFNMVIH
jgi:hypothetical protein